MAFSANIDPPPALRVLHAEVRLRVEAMEAAHANWPCRKGCDECCRRLASVPRVTSMEWRLIAAALESLPPATSAAARHRISESHGAARPVTCPLLDRDSGTCLVYEARPVACRTYGFYVERDAVLGCSRIERVSGEDAHVVWGNHVSIQSSLDDLGESMELAAWMNGEESGAAPSETSPPVPDVPSPFRDLS